MINIKEKIDFKNEKEREIKRINNLLDDFFVIVDEFISSNKVTSIEMLIIANTIIHRETTNNLDIIVENRVKLKYLNNKN